MCTRFVTIFTGELESVPHQSSPKLRQRALRLLNTAIEVSKAPEFEAIKSWRSETPNGNAPPDRRTLWSSAGPR